MNCSSELKYSMYVDGELTADEARLLETHLFVCPRCRALVDALRREGSFLASVLQTTGEERPESLRIGRSLLWTVLSAVAVVLILNEAADWLREWIPSTADWLNPFHLSTLLDQLFNVTMSLANVSEGVSMLNTIVTAIGALILGLSSLAGLYFVVKRRGSLPVALLTSVVVVLSLPSLGSAIEIRHGARAAIASNETIDGTLIVNADSVNVDGTVNGDLIVTARVVTVRGQVKGDILTFSQTFDLNGSVDGNLYGCIRWLTIRGTLERNLYAWAHSIEVASGGRVAGDAVVGTDNVRFSGALGRDVLLLGGNVQMQGNVGRDFHAEVHNITISGPGRIAGNLTLAVKDKNDVHLDPSVTVGGKTDIRIQPRELSRYAHPKFYFWEAVKLAAALLTGLLCAWLFPPLFRAPLNRASAVLKTAGVGFLVLVATPVAALILGVTLVGMPIALLTMFTWLAGLYLAKVFVGAFVGQEILKSQAGPPRPFVLSLLLGLCIIFVATDLPYVGGVVTFLVIVLGLGIVASQVHRHWPRSTRSRGPEVADAMPAGSIS
jgi:cytoskeletal protein CcmA (bactofilin family)